VTLHPHAASLFLLADPRWRQKVFVGGMLLLLAPPFGWPAVLGYRKELVRHLFEDLEEPLPAWEGRLLHHFTEGLKALGVIFGYLAPLYATAGGLAAYRGFTPGAGSLVLALFFVLFPIFSTLSFPIGCLLLGHAGWLSMGECSALVGLYALVVFLIPAGFLHVSLTGRYRTAFALWRTLPFVGRHLPAYAGAWWYSSLISLVGHLALPFSPWGVVWAYLAIIFQFNEILHQGGERISSGWLARALADPRFARRGRPWLARLEDGRRESTAVLDLGAFSVPLPRCFPFRALSSVPGVRA
jgi:hypothetical protein